MIVLKLPEIATLLTGAYVAAMIKNNISDFMTSYVLDKCSNISFITKSFGCLL